MCACCSVIGSIFIVIGLYSVLWGKHKERVEQSKVGEEIPLPIKAYSHHHHIDANLNNNNNENENMDNKEFINNGAQEEAIKTNSLVITMPKAPKSLSN